MPDSKRSPLQEKHYDAIKWLLDPISNRAEGRTHLLASIYIDLAIQYPGCTITIHDHHPNFMADEMLTSLIKLTLSRDKETLKFFTFTRTSIMFSTKNYHDKLTTRPIRKTKAH